MTTSRSDSGSADDHLAERTAILTRMLSDQQEGGLRSLDEYQAQWPGLDEVVREEFESLVSEALEA